ncbi:subtilisin-like protease SBT3.9 isoform X2 [Cucurbita moschata]|uniref:Subtilisin-like protease SBT3.9 isoform X2 n=1 Tax=Cucurbita moschata TaxID=3662 RepID=A0A6J1EUE2_CUCMO|nr:subtilisin-like protease SBT3.9 isoform X2 [Cucurbita moschata]
MENNRASSFMHAVVTIYAVFSAMAEADNQNSKVYIAYLGERPYEDVKLTTDSHHELLESVMGSKEKSLESMMYSYRHGFSGFAAKLTNSQAQKLALARVFPSSLYKMRTTRSWDFLGLSSSPSASSNLLHRAKMGDNVIIGVIDTGFWPESESFNDKGMGPIPSRWKGICQSGEDFNSSHCNKKVIGARWFARALIADHGEEAVFKDYLSARDNKGHGTHTASTAGGAFVRNVSYFGNGRGTLRGGAPLARLAIYKVLWSDSLLGSDADILKGIDEAIHDGVDVLSMSIGKSIPLFPVVYDVNPVAVGSFHAIAKGISVVCAGGNEGSIQQTVENVAPWLFTVAASTIDRAFLASITTLGDNATYLGQTFLKKDVVGKLVVMDRRCAGILGSDIPISGNVVLLCFIDLAMKAGASNAVMPGKQAKVVGVIYAGQHNDILGSGDIPSIYVDTHVGTKLFNYLITDDHALIRLTATQTIIGKPISSRIAFFSSRGPNSVSPGILKPDIAAPGSNIIAAVPPNHKGGDKGFAAMSGTSMATPHISMATPHISGIVALIKSLRPTWSPAAIKSALITTARVEDLSEMPIFAEGSPRKVADPFDYGGGVVDANAAADPGLIYDLGATDYIYYYLCSMGYTEADISHLSQQKTVCSSKRASILDLNLPTITIPALTNSTTVTRTVTNVGNLTAVYKAVIKAPPGSKVRVKPRVLVFNSNVKKISFKVKFSSTLQRNYGYSFGRLTWTDGVHLVKSPLSVRFDFF